MITIPVWDRDGHQFEASVEGVEVVANPDSSMESFRYDRLVVTYDLIGGEYVSGTEIRLGENDVFEQFDEHAGYSDDEALEFAIVRRLEALLRNVDFDAEQDAFWATVND